MTKASVDAVGFCRVQALVNEFWGALDHRRFDDVLARTTPDIRWQRERWYEGQAAVRAALAARPAGLLIRHVLTNLIVTRSDAGLEARLLMQARLAMLPDGATPPFAGTPAHHLTDVTVQIVEQDDALLIAEIAFDLIFSETPAG